jgi:hypothetical protein|tara:strand:- start:252 stop:431 length:180 start_codon:yes stop_codon:yes gene_type:complete
MEAKMEYKINNDKQDKIIDNFAIINDSEWTEQDKKELLASSIFDNVVRIAQEHRDFYES